MNVRGSSLAAGAVLLMIPVVAQAGRAGWTFSTMQTMTKSCRESILDKAIRDFAARRNVAVGDLPGDFRPKVEAALEPILKSCDCMTGKVADRWEYADYLANEAKYRTEVQAMIQGECAPPKEVRG